jgi:hypothetical protein
MSLVTDVYNQISTKLAETFPSATRIPYSYSIADNNSNFLKNGFGLIVGSASFQEFEFCNRVSSREISVVFSKEVFRTDSDFVKIDDIVKDLLENVNTVQGLFYAYDELGIEDKILKVDIGNTSGLEEVIANNSKFLTMTASFSFQIKESF